MQTTKPTSRLLLNKEALFADLGYEPHPGQLAVHRSRAPRRVLVCGVRWGKSTVGVMEAVAALLEPCDESLGWIVAPTFDLSDRIVRQARDVLRKHLKHRIVGEDPREHSLVVRNLGGGLSEVRARSADNPASLLGEGLDWLIVDEAARLKADVWEGHLSQRLVDRDGWALLTSTPRGGGWFRDLYRRGQGRDAAFESWNFPTWTNPLLDREVVERERERLPDQTFRQEFGAEFIGKFIDRCEICGDPRPEGPGIVVLLEHDAVLATCETCGEPVDDDGLALRKLHDDGTTELVIIRMGGPVKDPPPMPGDEPDDDGG